MQWQAKLCTERIELQDANRMRQLLCLLKRGAVNDGYLMWKLLLTDVKLSQLLEQSELFARLARRTNSSPSAVSRSASDEMAVAK
jgi:hypothetical protein